MSRPSKSRRRLRRKTRGRSGLPQRRTGPQGGWGEKGGSLVYHQIQGPWIGHLAALVLLMVATCWLYRGALNLGFFHLDDPTYVVNNPWIREVSFANIKQIVTTPYFANYSPLHLLSYMPDYRVGSGHPWWFHVSNVLWAGLVAGGVYFLALVLLPRVGFRGADRSENAIGVSERKFWGWSPVRLVDVLALLAALLFVAHPVHVEAAAWISSRKDLVAAAFGLPAMLAYFGYRREPGRRIWYVVSLMLFFLAVSAKLSVVVIPAILLVFDWLVERRRGWGLLLDKVPYGTMAVLFVLPTLGAQPSTGNAFDLYVLGHSMAQNFWLLTGLGTHVLLRPPPNPNVPMLLKGLCVAWPGFAVVLPWLLRRRLPAMVSSLWYFVLLGMIPPLVLSFVHPVTDRYLFFPSAGAVLLLVWVGAALYSRAAAPTRKGWEMILPGTLLGLVLVWGNRTVNYLAEWQDPRSVWYAASAKSDDVKVYQYLGTHYQDHADRLPALLRGEPVEREKAFALAKVIWKEDPRLDSLLQQWQSSTNHNDVLTRAYQAHLRRLAGEQYDRALQVRSTILVPNLYFRIGKLALDENQLDQARVQFKRAMEQAGKSTYPRVREEVTIRSLHALGLVDWKAGNHEAALASLRKAEEAQTRSGKNYVPELPQHLQRLQALLQSRPFAQPP